MATCPENKIKRAFYPRRKILGVISKSSTVIFRGVDGEQNFATALAILTLRSGTRSQSIFSLQRAAHVGVNPSDTIMENLIVHERVRCTVEDYGSNRQFDVATLRMVAEHIVEPGKALDSLASLLKPGGKEVIYTPNRWSPLSFFG